MSVLIGVRLGNGVARYHESEGLQRKSWRKVLTAANNRRRVITASRCLSCDSCVVVSLWRNGNVVVASYLSEQYNTELLGTTICFSQVVLHNC
jgi:hypothetical protein